MSRTKKGGKAGGYEYWSARPHNSAGQSPGAFSKRRTHRAERQGAKQELRQQHNDARAE